MASAPTSPVPVVGTQSLNHLISPLRDASRKLVREWGFLRPTLAESTLSPAAVHCLLEIGDHGRRAFPELCGELKVTPKQLGSTLSELITSGQVKLAEQGTQTLDEINRYAQNQVTKALAEAPPGNGTDITAAFCVYTAALEKARLARELPTPGGTPAATPDQTLSPFGPPAVAIVPGYRPGILGRTIEMHLDFYNKALGGAVWAAVMQTPGKDKTAALSSSPPERIVGVVYIDGESSGQEGVARLRAFIVDDCTRGLGVGKKLFGAAMEFVREVGFKECLLTTAMSLTVARKMYEAEGFEKINEVWYDGWLKGVLSIEYRWSRPKGTENPTSV
ncbi:hypothetical protein QBC35DRAFT_514828 [Podospora australis]|uniref:N-acetyltransferase domain-containing protein n=1 Tax=Podospora australis TaxID=1536484 RepID=A0AAN7AIY0_9PEZI|nr:hypothetical protein QBC35DRAFT_514828 [Podospora australis]